MTTSTTDALVSSRICHDLISPVGAIGNGLELLDALGSSTPELALIAESVDSAKAKLQFFRICFGQSTAESTVAARDVQATADAMLTTARQSLVWQDLAPSSPRQQVKLLYLALLCVETALPLGGVISVAQTRDGWEIRAQATRLQQDDIWRVLDWDMPPEPITPARVQFVQLRDLARDMGLVPKIGFAGDVLTVSL